MDSITVTLAGKGYIVKQLNLGQLRDLSIGVTLPDAEDPQETIGRSFDRAVSVIAAAIREMNPELNAQALYKMSITRNEMREATDLILKFAGLITETTPGETAGAA
jgi:hypothetical protein